jgi:hypothetical protein
MWSELLARWGGPCAILGGLLWIACAVVVSQMPEGCMADECYLPGRSMRSTDPVAPALAAAIALLAVGMVALAQEAARVGRLGRMGRFGLVLAAGGSGLLVAATMMQTLFFGGDLPFMPFFVIPGGLAFVLGVLLLAVAILRADVLPRWIAVVLVAGTLALIGYNDQNARVLMGVPFGVAWIAVGWSILTNPAK